MLAYLIKPCKSFKPVTFSSLKLASLFVYSFFNTKPLNRLQGVHQIIIQDVIFLNLLPSNYSEYTHYNRFSKVLISTTIKISPQLSYRLITTFNLFYNLGLLNKPVIFLAFSSSLMKISTLLTCELAGYKAATLVRKLNHSLVKSSKKISSSKAARVLTLLRPYALLVASVPKSYRVVNALAGTNALTISLCDYSQFDIIIPINTECNFYKLVYMYRAYNLYVRGVQERTNKILQLSVSGFTRSINRGF